MRHRLPILTLLLVFALTVDSMAVDFTADIRPILAEKCTGCHGGVKQKGGLSFLSRKSALAKAKSGDHAIVPGDPDAGTLLYRITTDDMDERMPPEGDPLTADEAARIRQWIKEGAEWPDHWWFEPPVQPTVPELNSQWPKNEIDHFILSRLNEAKVTPSPTADRTTLIRRLSLDLTGLPPSIEEVDAFVNDKHADSYERLVDRLLASAHFGERWGRHWLDRARYADSDGYEKDKARPNAWRWRNWVIEAVNKDMPYDQFTIEQLAGDLLPKAKSEHRLATAFHRQTLFNSEGGVDPEEDRTKRLIDRVNTTAGVWLGLTMACTQCHHHPYDPLTQREFYQLYAFFNNTDETTTPIRRSGSEEKRRELEQRLNKAKSGADKRFAAWLDKQQTLVANEVPMKKHPVSLLSAASAKGQTLDFASDGIIAVSGKLPASDTYTVELTLPPGRYTGIHLKTIADKSLPGKGPGLSSHGNFVLNTVIATLIGDGKDQAITFTKATADFSQDKWDVSGIIDTDIKSGWAISPQMGKNHEAFLWSPGFEVSADERLRIELVQQYGNEHFIGRFQLSGLTGSPSASKLPAAVRKLLAKTSRTDKDTAKLRAHFDKHADSAVAGASRALAAFDKKNTLRVRVLKERGTPRDTYVFHRGDFLQPAKDLGKVQPNVAAVLPPLKARDPKAGADRLDLAHWLVSGENPLTARVAVNDVWLHLFGQPLATPVDDWGTRAEPPVHPLLIDWLALEYPRLGWSRKRLIKTIVMSATYQQSSVHRPELLEKDPGNLLFHRQNRMRVEGEIIRDIFLTAANLLSPQVGGPSVFPPIPNDVAMLSYANQFKWKESKGANRYRRGMYTFFKRTAPDPNLMTFDCPDSNVTIAKRGASNTPLQALATLQNTVFHEAAQALAGLVLTAPGDDSTRLALAFRRSTARQPQADELQLLQQLLETNRKTFRDDPAAAQELAVKHVPEGTSAAEAAAWIATTRIILNLDEVITRE